jgi:hypothetical protein
MWLTTMRDEGERQDQYDVARAQPQPRPRQHQRADDEVELVGRIQECLGAMPIRRLTKWKSRTVTEISSGDLLSVLSRSSDF